jgi:hypothetical protein
MIQTTIRNAEGPIARRVEFDAGSLHGEWISRHPSGALVAPTGQLPPHLADTLGELLNEKGRLYVVYSYGTPIAWGVGLGPLVVPTHYYSVTTSKHQGIARRAS